MKQVLYILIVTIFSLKSSFLRRTHVILNLALLLMGIGIGVLIALMLQETVGYNDVLYPAIIFLIAGTGFTYRFFLYKKISKRNNTLIAIEIRSVDIRA